MSISLSSSHDYQDVNSDGELGSAEILKLTSFARKAGQASPVQKEPAAAPAEPHSVSGDLEGEPYPGYLDQDALRFFYRWGGHLSATLIRVRARFDGDLDQHLIYLIFVLAELSRRLTEETAAARGRAPAKPGPRGLNALSVAEITRIPRETTRRKLKALTEEGYLSRGPDGLLYLSGRHGLDEFFFDLKPLFWDGLQVAGRQA